MKKAGQRDKASKSGTVPPKAGRMVTLSNDHVNVPIVLGTGTYVLPLHKIISFYLITRGHLRLTYSVRLVCSVFFGLHSAKVGSQNSS